MPGGLSGVRERRAGRWFAGLALVAGCAQTSAFPAPTTPRAAAFLAHCRAELGVLNALRGTGRCELEEAAGTFVLQGHPTGAFVRRVESERSYELGFDGTEAWLQDAKGCVRTLSFGARASVLANAWLQTHAWLDPTQTEFTFEILRDTDRTTTLRARHTLSPWQGDLEIDGRELVPRRLIEQAASGERETRFADWRRVGDTPVAFRVEQWSSGRLRSTWTLDSAEEATELDASSRPRHAPSDARFDPSVPPRVPLRRLASGHLVTRPLVDGKNIGWLLLDTGSAGLCIDESIANQLSLELLGPTSAIGPAGSQAGRLRRARELRLGPLTIDTPEFLALDLGFLRESIGMRVAGILGYDFFARATVAIDASAESMTLTPFDAQPAAREWAPILFAGTKPCVQAEFPGGSGWFRLDTGSDGNVTFHRLAAREVLTVGERENISAVGVGGAIPLERGVLPWFRFAGHEFGVLETDLYRGRAGPLAHEATSGLIGVGLLNRGGWTLDYARGRFAFEPH